MRRISHADQRPKQNHKEENLPALHQEQFLSGRERGPMLNQGNILSPGMVHCPHWSDDKWKKSMAGEGGNKKRYQCCTDSSGAILYLRGLQGHSGRILIDPTLQDKVVIPSNFFQYFFSCWMCNQLIFHHQFRIDTLRSKFKQQTDSVLSACGSNGQESQRS